METDATAATRDDDRPKQSGPAWEAAIAWGIDVSLLERNLALTVEERLAQLQAMTRLYELLRPRDEKDDAGQP